MKSLAERILELLHYHDTDPIFTGLCDELKLLQSPVFQYGDSAHRHYALRELGVSLYCYEGAFYSAHFYIQPAAIEGENTNPYCNALPLGLDIDHTISDVHRLLGPPVEVNKPLRWLQISMEASLIELSPGTKLSYGIQNKRGS